MVRVGFTSNAEQAVRKMLIAAAKVAGTDALSVSMTLGVGFSLGTVPGLTI
jgi:hypothetical protein